MARLLFAGFDAPDNHFATGDDIENVARSISGGNEAFVPGRNGGYAWTLDQQKTNTDFKAEAELAGTGVSPIYERFYLRIRELPNAYGECFCYWLTNGDRSSNPIRQSAWGIVRPTGTLEFYTRSGSTSVLIGTITEPLELWRWYRINIYVKTDTGNTGAEAFSVSIDGAPAAGATSGVRSFEAGTPFGLSAIGGSLTGSSAIIWLGLGQRNDGGTPSPLATDDHIGNGGAFDFDDWVIDNATAPGPGGVTLVRPISAGTYSEWLTNDYRRCRNMELGQNGTIASNGASTRLSFNLEPLSKWGIVPSALYGVRVIGNVSAPRDNWKFGLLRNGVEAYDPAAITLSTEPAGGWQQLTPGYAITDTFEAILKDGTGAGTNAVANFLGIIFDWEMAAEPTAPEVSQDIQIYTGTFVGTSDHQDITLDFDSPATPDLIIIKPDTTAAVRVGGWWHRGMGVRGDFSSNCDTGNWTGPIAWVDENKFTVRATGAGHGCNVTGETNRFIAIADPSGRMLDAFRYYMSNTDTDNRSLAIPDQDFTIEGLLTNWAGVTGADETMYHGPSHVGDASSYLDADLADAADLIASIGAGAFTAGLSLQAATGCVSASALAMRTTDVFNLNPMLVQGSYVGDGVASRDIDLPFTTDPGFILVIPSNTQPRCCRFGSQVGTANYRWNVTTVNASAGITDFTATKFTVTTGTPSLNATGVTYYYIAFASGADLAVMPEVELPEGGIGITWVEVTDRAGTMRPWAKVDLADPSTYYGGFKESRVTRWGVLSRALSDRDGQFEQADFNWEVHDTDRLVRGLLNADSTKYFKNRPAVVRIIDDEHRRLLHTPRTVIRGFITDYKPLSQLHFSFKAHDIITAKFAAVGKNPAQVPSRTVSTDDFPNCPEDNRGLTVPIIYGEVSDENEVTELVPGSGTSSGALQAPTGLTAVVQGAGGGVTRRYAVTAYNGLYGQWTGSGDHRGETDAAYIDVAGCPEDNQLSPANRVKVTWNDVPGATGYRVYGRTPGLLKFLDFGDNTGMWGLPGPTYYDGMRPYGVAEFDILKLDGDPPSTNNTLADGVVTPDTTITTDRGNGVVPVIYTGQKVLGDGNTWHQFLICGHAIKSILGWYQAGVRLAATTEDATAGPYLMPGYAGYTSVVGAATYVDINGRRYTVCYGLVGTQADKVARDEEALTLNVQGIEDVGDGSGDLITDVLMQYKHAVLNWVLGNYASGAWLASPVFEDDPDLTQVDEASFDAASAIAQLRISGGYIGGGIIGANGEVLTVRDLIARFNQSADVDCGFNRKCQFIVSMVDDSIDALVNATPLTDVQNIFSGSFDVRDDLASHFNVVPFRYARDYGGVHPNTIDGFITADEASDSTSITNYTSGTIDGTVEAPNLNLELVRDQATADDVAYRKLLRQKDPPRIVTFSIGLSGFNYELGQILSISHYEGVGATGWAGQPLRILRHEADPDQFQVTLELFDMQQLFSGAFVLGDETVLPAAWTSATTAQKNYGYLCDETTGLFSDGRHGKRLR